MKEALSFSEALEDVGCDGPKRREEVFIAPNSSRMTPMQIR